MSWNLTIANQRAIRRRPGGFTLIEVLVATLFMVVVIPVALGAMRVASVAGEATQRKLVAARVATKVINELRIENMLLGAQRGVFYEDGVTYSWSQQTEFWIGDTTSQLYMATITVAYDVAGRHCNVQLSTLVPPVIR
jgi:type II secretory pathway pseudopilin PulG